MLFVDNNGVVYSAPTLTEGAKRRVEANAK
jgi:hypothetical protein